MNIYKTAECVTPKHPDKMCDQISDAILDHCLLQDPFSRVAIETMGGHGKVYVTGELTTKATITNTEIEHIVGAITGKELEVHVNIVKQSPEIANGVDTGGAGDQGIMVGYACNDNEDMIPKEAYLARSLCKFLYNRFPFDGKTQVTLAEDGFMSVIVASFQNVDGSELEEQIKNWVDTMNYPRAGLRYYANPAGDWDQGGFDADTGLTGRKLIVDNYGPQVAIGGGCFSGKDSTKVDRSGAYMARRIAVQILKANSAKEVEVKIAYAIGVAEPVMATARIVAEDGCVEEINLLRDSDYDMTPKNIIEELDLRVPQFKKTAEWGHFGNGFTWDN